MKTQRAFSKAHELCHQSPRPFLDVCHLLLGVQIWRSKCVYWRNYLDIFSALDDRKLDRLINNLRR